MFLWRLDDWEDILHYLIIMRTFGPNKSTKNTHFIFRVVINHFNECPEFLLKGLLSFFCLFFFKLTHLFCLVLFHCLVFGTFWKNALSIESLKVYIYLWKFVFLATPAASFFPKWSALLARSLLIQFSSDRYGHSAVRMACITQRGFPHVHVFLFGEWSKPKCVFTA